MYKIISFCLHISKEWKKNNIVDLMQEGSFWIWNLILCMKNTRQTYLRVHVFEWQWKNLIWH